MTEEELKLIAAQLRKPHGDFAVKVGNNMNKANWLMNQYTIDELKVKLNDHILEIGMGNGFFVKYILSVDHSVKYTGCDFSEVMVEEAYRYNEQYVKSGQTKFQLANAAKLPFEDGMFDKVFTINTIYFWEDIKIVLSEIRRVLKSKGQFVIAIRPKSTMDNFSITKFGFKTFSKTDLIDILTENGFIINGISEKEEAEQEFFGKKMKDEFLIISAVLS